MPDIKFSVGKKIYSIASENEESGARIVDIAAHLNKRVNEIALNLRELDDSTCVVLAGILILSEFEDFKKKQPDLFEKPDITSLHISENNELNNDLVQISRHDLEYIFKKMQNIESLLDIKVAESLE